MRGETYTRQLFSAYFIGGVQQDATFQIQRVKADVVAARGCIQEKITCGMFHALGEGVKAVLVAVFVIITDGRVYKPHVKACDGMGTRGHAGTRLDVWQGQGRGLDGGKAFHAGNSCTGRGTLFRGACGYYAGDNEFFPGKVGKDYKNKN